MATWVMSSPNKVEIQIRCKGLANLDDEGGISDPFAQVYIKTENETVWFFLGRTEV